MKKYIYVANWKMFLSFNQAKKWLDNNQQIPDFSSHLILCPSYEILAYAAELAKKNNFLVGAQDCSEHALGAYTGQISALSLAEIGCSYCIIGHSEQRAYLTNTIIINKLTQLQKNKITPILCVSTESLEQLEPAINFIQKYPENNLLIAYEPLESIGSGQVASSENISQAIARITNLLPHNTHYKILYGGSISPENISTLKKIDKLDGFLIGSASTDIQKLTAIIQAPPLTAHPDESPA